MRVKLKQILVIALCVCFLCAVCAPPAHAVVTEAALLYAAMFGLAGAFGLTFLCQSVSQSDLISHFEDAVNDWAVDAEAWKQAAIDGLSVGTSGELIVGADAANAITDFLSDYATNNSVVAGGGAVILDSKFTLGGYPIYDIRGYSEITAPGFSPVFVLSEAYTRANPLVIELADGYTVRGFVESGCGYTSFNNPSSFVKHRGCFSFGLFRANVSGSDCLTLMYVPLDGSTMLVSSSDYDRVSWPSTVGTSTISAVAGETYDLPVLNPGQELVLDGVGTSGMTLDDIKQAILSGVLEGTLAAEGTITETAPITPDVDGLGLPALGAALTSRFPFSIPWDVQRVFNLLDADPVAPYFHVDLLENVDMLDAPGIVELDMSEEPYPKIGVICRWATTIGFCLALALGTKRLIWTA